MGRAGSPLPAVCPNAVFRVHGEMNPVGSAPSVFIRVHLWLKVARFFPVFHRGFASLVVGAGTAFGHTRGGNFGDDVVHGIRR